MTQLSNCQGTFSQKIYSLLESTRNALQKDLDWNITPFIPEPESVEYGACEFDAQGQKCKLRIGKMTPKKAGFFVTLWKRSNQGPIEPCDLLDPIDTYLFFVQDSKHSGLFIFPKEVLEKNGLLSNQGKGGKRAIRIYPPWIKSLNKQAQAAQTWQQNYFHELFMPN